MRNAVTLGFIGIFSLLMANEAAKSAVDVLDNAKSYESMGLPTHSQYALLSSGFLMCGIVCIVVAIGLFLFTEKQSQNHTK